MARSSPEKLAKALRANLKKRKSGPTSGVGANAANTGETPAKPPASQSQFGSKTGSSGPGRAKPD